MKVFAAKDPEGNFVVPTVSEQADLSKRLLVSSMTMVLAEKKGAASFEEKIALGWTELEKAGFSIVEADLT